MPKQVIALFIVNMIAALPLALLSVLWVGSDWTPIARIVVGIIIALFASVIWTGMGGFGSYATDEEN